MSLLEENNANQYNIEWNGSFTKSYLYLRDLFDHVPPFKTFYYTSFQNSNNKNCKSIDILELKINNEMWRWMFS